MTKKHYANAGKGLQGYIDMITSMSRALAGRDPKFTEEEWREGYAEFVRKGVPGKWEDDYEPAFSKAVQSDIPGDAVHRFLLKKFPKVKSNYLNALLERCLAIKGRRADQISPDDLETLKTTWQQFRQEQIPLEISRELNE